MTRTSRYLLLAGALALAFGTLAPQPAEASLVRVCAADRSNAPLGPRQVVAPSGTTYSVDGRGCTLASYADALGLSSALGFIVDPGVAFVTAATTSTAFSPIRIPAGAIIDSITVRESSGSFVLGGLKFGTTGGGSDIAFWGSGSVGTATPATVVSISTGTITQIPDASMRKRAFSSTVPQDIHFDTQGNFGSAAVDILIHYSFF